jgi:hypothetical protein
MHAHLEPAQILVTPSTDPGWTPLFMTASALVMEMGGVISHGAVVARVRYPRSRGGGAVSFDATSVIAKSRAEPRSGGLG